MAVYTFSCPNCDSERRVNEALAGHKVRCPDCGEMVDVPQVADMNGAGDVVALESTEPEPAAPPATPPPAPKLDLSSVMGDAAEEYRSSDDGDDGDDGGVEEVDFNREKPDEGDMDMTPMVDVTFLLLIFFMVTAAFSLQKAIQVPKPEQTNEPSTQVMEDDELPEDQIIVIVDQFNTFRVQTAELEEEAPSKHDLLRKLRRARDSAPPGSVPNKLLVKAHGDAFHERVVMALDAGVEVGMEQVQVMTVEEDL
ncbi:MAG: biopolymer transporter ExbD [Pirellulaceae bacterium]|nr:biopolymer transporter ExbD [Pirellulaceae bacterium]